MFSAHKVLLSRVFLILIATINLFAFQNCSEGFRVQEDLASVSFDSTSLSVPEISFAPTALDLYNTDGVTIDFTVKLTGSAKLKSLTCELNNDAPQDCMGKSVSYVNLADGDYTLKIDAETSAGVRSQATRVFRKDRTAPVVAVSMTPALITGATTANFVFSATDNLSGVDRIECSLDNAAFAVCVSPVNIAVAAGSHDYRIRAFDKAANISLVYSYSWSVDITAPVLAIGQKPNAFSNSASASFTFSSSKPSTFECQIDNGAFAACSSPRDYANLAAGNHTFAVRGTDSANNVSQPTSYTWMIDVVAPSVPVLASNVQTITQSKSASISFSSTDVASGIASFECSLNNAAFAACVSPRALTNLAEGNQSLRVRALDNAGNVSAIATSNWRVDSVAPIATFTQTPLVSTTQTSANFAFTTADANGSGVVSTQCSLDNGPFANCVSPTTLNTLAVGAHSFRVQLRDAANNMSAIITHNWTITAPIVVPVISSFTATPATITAGDSTLLTWSVSGATSITIDGAVVTGTTKMYTPNATKTYTLVATNSAGSVSMTRTVTVNPAVITWTVPPISFVVGSGSTFDLASTLPAGIIKNGVFTVDPSGLALPAGMTLTANGVVGVGTAVVGTTDGVVFAYTEP